MTDDGVSLVDAILMPDRMYEDQDCTAYSSNQDITSKLMINEKLYDECSGG